MTEPCLVQASFATMTDKPAPSRKSGLVQGGRGGPDDELLESGQEEVFSRTEVESGHIEHHTGDEEVREAEPRPDAPRH